MKTINSEFLLSNRHVFNHHKCVFVVGAGISVASGIPDFRSSTGIFSTLRQQLKVDGRQLFSYNFGIKEGTRQIYLKYISDLKILCDSALPNPVHHFLASYPRSRIYTQNIDGLEERAGIVFSKANGTKGVYLHGNLSMLCCQYCGFKQKFTEMEHSKFKNAEEVECAYCLERRQTCILNNTRRRPVGVMHPGFIHYQQAHPDGAFIGKMTELDRDCDLLIVIGTSLKVEGIKKMVKAFSRLPFVGGKRILVNLTKPTKEWNDVFDYFYEGDCLEFASQLMPGLRISEDAKSARDTFSVDKAAYEVAINQTTKDSASLVDKEVAAVPVPKSLVADSLRRDRTAVVGEEATTPLAFEGLMADSPRRNRTVVVDKDATTPIALRDLASGSLHSNAESSEGHEKASRDDVVEPAAENTATILTGGLRNTEANFTEHAVNGVKVALFNPKILFQEAETDRNAPTISKHIQNINSAVRKISVSREGDTSVEDDKSSSYLSDERYDKLLLKNSPLMPQSKLHSKLEKLSETFTGPESISEPILNEVLKETRATQIPGEDEYVCRQPDSSFRDLEEEMASIVASEARSPAPAADSSKISVVIKLPPTPKKNRKVNGKK